MFSICNPHLLSAALAVRVFKDDVIRVEQNAALLPNSRRSRLDLGERRLWGREEMQLITGHGKICGCSD